MLKILAAVCLAFAACTPDAVPSAPPGLVVRAPARGAQDYVVAVNLWRAGVQVDRCDLVLLVDDEVRAPIDCYPVTPGTIPFGSVIWHYQRAAACGPHVVQVLTADGAAVGPPQVILQDSRDCGLTTWRSFSVEAP